MHHINGDVGLCLESLLVINSSDSGRTAAPEIYHIYYSTSSFCGSIPRETKHSILHRLYSNDG